MKRLYILFTIIAGLTFNGAFSMQGQQSRKRKRPVMEKRLAHGESEKYIPTQGAHKKRKRVQKKQGLIQKQDGADVPTRQTVKNHNKKNVKTAPRKRKRLKKQGFPTAQSDQSDLPVRVSEKVEDEEQDDDTLVSQVAKRVRKPIEEIKGVSCFTSGETIPDMLFVPLKVAEYSQAPVFRAHSNMKHEDDNDRSVLDKKRVRRGFVLKAKDFSVESKDDYCANRDLFSYGMDEDFEDSDHPTGEPEIIPGAPKKGIVSKDIKVAYKMFINSCKQSFDSIAIQDHDDPFGEFRFNWQGLLYKMRKFILFYEKRRNPENSDELLKFMDKEGLKFGQGFGNNLSAVINTACSKNKEIVRLLFLADFVDIPCIFTAVISVLVSRFQFNCFSINYLARFPDHIKEHFFRILCKRNRRCFAYIGRFLRTDFFSLIVGFCSDFIEIDVSHNRLTVVPERIGDLKNLLKLNLSHNKLTSVPERIGDLKSLYKLDLSHNSLTDLPWDAIKEIVSFSDRFLVLCIIGNNITADDIPDDIKRNKKIKIDILG